jgi:hypothetical protein
VGIHRLIVQTSQAPVLAGGMRLPPCKAMRLLSIEHAIVAWPLWITVSGGLFTLGGCSRGGNKVTFRSGRSNQASAGAACGSVSVSSGIYDLAPITRARRSCMVEKPASHATCIPCCRPIQRMPQACTPLSWTALWPLRAACKRMVGRQTYYSSSIKSYRALAPG